MITPSNTQIHAESLKRFLCLSGVFLTSFNLLRDFIVNPQNNYFHFAIHKTVNGQIKFLSVCESLDKRSASEK